MKSNELRIGNYIYSLETQNHQRITGLLEEQPFFDAITFDYPNYDEIEPIPLTEEWLLKFGFEKKGKRISKGWFYLWDENGIIVFALAEMHNEIGQYLNIKHVHQLQNLYFALTGEKLTIKTKTI